MNEEVLAPGNLPFQLHLLVQQMNKKFQEILQPHRITPLHWGILCCLWEEDGLRTSDIATRLEQLGGTVTVGLDSMEDRDLISRRQQDADKRVFRIHLTETGRNLRAALEPAAKALIAEIFSCLTRDEYLALTAKVAKLRRHLGD